MSDENVTRRCWPAEWKPHTACIMLYPHNPGTFRLEKAISEFMGVVRAIANAGNEPVVIFCKDDETASSAKKQLRQEDDCSSSNITVLVCRSNDSWIRDTGPTFVLSTTTRNDDAAASSNAADDDGRRRSLVGLDWGFNAYGGEKDGCYWPCTEDQQVAATICKQMEIFSPDVIISHKKLPLILEGGSIHTDGEGTILTTKECLLNPNRNPDLSQFEIESIVLRETGCIKMIWLEHGLANDNDTNGHIDNFCCFVAPRQVVLAWTDDDIHDAENYQRCRAALELLESSTDAQGRSLIVHKLYLPKQPICYTQSGIDSMQFGTYENTQVFARSVGERMAASYVNFYIGNTAVIVPQFGDHEYDAKAVATLQELLIAVGDRQRTVVGVPSREILIGGGNIHCITQQVPQM